MNHYSPGPWHVEVDPKYSSLVVIKDSNGDEIDRMFALSQQREMANARLIAAAPELLECLQSYVPDHLDKQGHMKWFKKMKAIIIKATTGEDQA